MRATKALLIGAGLLLVAFGVYMGLAWVFRGVRVGPVKQWMRSAKGFGPAKSAEDALDKFKQAIEKRDYDAAAQYLGGEYREFFEKSIDDGESLANEIDNLNTATKKHGVKSGKGDVVLYLLDPFPGGFKYTTAKGEGDAVTATLRWDEAIKEATSRGNGLDSVRDWKIDGKMLHSLLPWVTDHRVPLVVTVKKETDGTWRIYVPVGNSARHVRDTVEYLRKNGSNYKNALQGLKNDVKNEPQTKENFESALRSKLEQSQ